MANQAQNPNSSAKPEGGSAASDAGDKTIPVGMSANDMRASNEAAVQQIEDAGKQAGIVAENERIAAIDAAFKDDPEYAAQCRATKGMTVEQAKAAKFDTLKAANAELTKKNEELTKAAAEKDPSVEFASSDSEGGSASVAEGTVNEKDAKSVEIWNKNEKLRTAFNGNKGAFQACYRNDPETALSFGK